jgi:hypothetical protein
MFSSGPCENLYSHFSDFTEKEFEVKELMITFVIIVSQLSYVMEIFFYFIVVIS